MAIKSKKKIYLEYRYHKEDAWTVYDWTQVLSWADSAEKQMRQDHPGADYRRVAK